MANSYDADRHACTVVEAEFRAMSGVCSGLVEGLSHLLRWKDELLASSAEVPAKSLMSLAMISSNLHRSQTQLPGALKGLRKAIKHVVKLADPAEESARRAQRNWGIIVMALNRRAVTMGEMFNKKKGKKKKVVKKSASGAGAGAGSASSMRLKRSDSRASIMSSHDVASSFSKRRGSPKPSSRDQTPRGTPPNRSPRISGGHPNVPQQHPHLQHPVPSSPRLGGVRSSMHAHSPLSRGVSAKSEALPSAPLGGDGGGGGGGGGGGDRDDDLESALPPPPVALRRPRAQLPPPPVDLPNQRTGAAGGGSGRRGSGAGGGLAGGAAAGAGGNRRRSSARIASGQNAGAPARVSFEDATRGGGGGGGGSGGGGGGGGVDVVGGGSVGVGVGVGAGAARGGIGGVVGGGGTAAGASGATAMAAAAAVGGTGTGTGTGTGGDEMHHYELPPIGRLPSRESRGLGVGLLPAGYQHVQMPRTPNVEDARLPGLFEFSTDNPDHRRNI